MTRINADKATLFEGKPSTCARALHMMHGALQADQLTASDASKLRGLIQWLDSAIDGKPCRGSSLALSYRQYHDPEHRKLTTVLRQTLHYLMLVIARIPARTIFTMKTSKPIVIYSDCSEENKSPTADRRIDSRMRYSATLWKLGRPLMGA